MVWSANGSHSPGAGDVPAAGFGPVHLEREKRPGDVERQVCDALLFEGQQIFAEFPRHVAEPAAHFQNHLGLGIEPSELPELPHQEPAVSQPVQGVVGFPEQVRHGGLDEVEMAVVTGGICQLVMMEILEVLLPLESVLSRPAFADLLQQDVPLGLVAVAAGRFGAEVTERVVRRGPPFQMPSAWLAVGAADFRAIFLEERADRDVAGHRAEHLHADAVKAHQRQMVVEGREPVLVLGVLVGHQVRNTPGEEGEGLSGQREGFLDDSDGFHSGECVAKAQPTGRTRRLASQANVRAGAYSWEGNAASVTVSTPRMIGWIRQ